MEQCEATWVELDTLPNDNYKKMFAKFSDIDKLDPRDWKVPHLIGYFSKKYYQTYNKKYNFKFNSPTPSKCFEVFQIKKLSNVLTSDPSLLKEYIDWVFETKVAKAKRRITSISFMTSDYITTEYKLNVLLVSNKANNTIDRSTILPEKYKNIFIQANSPISTYGDLAFLSQMSDMPENLQKAFDTIKSMGFDINILSRVL
jgi:hypothetical protein